MLANRVVITVFAVALLNLACGGTNLGPSDSATQDSQSESPVLVPEAKSVSNLGGAILADCPSLLADVPLVDNPIDANEFQGWCSFKTDLDYDSVVDFYKTQLLVKGWAEFRTTQSEQKNSSISNHFYYEKSNRNIAIGVIHIISPDLVIVTIFPDHWIDQACDIGGFGIPVPSDIPIIGNMIGLCMEEYSWSGTEGFYTYSYFTLENFDDTVRFYRQEVTKSGWSLTDEYSEVSHIAWWFEKPGRTGLVRSGMDPSNLINGTLDHMYIEIQTIDEYGDTRVSIQVDNGP